jgi:hypothetical protein
LVDRLQFGTTLHARRWAAVATLAAAVVAVFAYGASAAAPTNQGPDLASMGLAASDFAAGASVQREGFTSPVAPAIAQYERLFRPGLRFGGHPIFDAKSAVYDFGSVGTAELAFDEVRGALTTRAGRRALMRALLANVPRGAGVAVPTAISAPVSMAVGQGAFRLRARFTLKSGTRSAWFELVFVFERTDRALAGVAFLSYPREHLATSIALLAAQRMGAHFRSAFNVRNLAPPSIGGTGQQGQTLTANAGSWAGAPSGFTYQWARCDSAGGNCTAIPGATGQTYVPGTADKGNRIVVTVTAANSVTTSSLTSAPTNPVS